MTVTRDSSEARTYEGGSYRHRPKGKGIYYVTPPCAMKRLAARYEYGADKYGQPEEFKKGLPVSDCMDSLLRHAFEYLDGDNSEDHMAAIAWNAFAIMHMEQPSMAGKWQDLPQRRGKRVNAYRTYSAGERTK